MQEDIKYASKNNIEYIVQKTKEYVATNYASKEELGNINTILDNINGEVV